MHRTTLALDDRIFARLREMATSQERPIQDCANELLELGLSVRERPGRKPVALPVYRMGRPLVDLSDREALLDALDGDWDSPQAVP